MFSSLYHFDGHIRLALWFGNPNLAGGFLVMLAVTAWAFVWLCPRRLRLGAALAAAVALPLYLAVGLTYSRGAYMALGSVLTVLAMLRTWRNWRSNRLRTPRTWLHWLPPALFLAVLLCLPAGGKRLAGVTNYSGDLSILHRLYLWRGGTMLVAQYPLHGVGEPPGRFYERFYQPLGKDERYAGMINDFLYHATSRGLPAGGGLLALALLPIALAFAIWHRHDDEIALQLAAALGAFVVAGLFNTCTGTPASRWCYGVIALLILLRTLWTAWCKRGERVPWRQRLLAAVAVLAIPATLALSVCIGVHALGSHFLSRWYFTVEPDVLECENANDFRLIPHTPNGTRVEFFADDLHACLRTELLPLVADGYEVSAHHSQGGLAGIATIRQILEARPVEENTPWLMIAAGDTANAALAAVTALPEERQPSGTVLIGAIFRHPFPELAIEERHWEKPLTIISTETSDNASHAALAHAFPLLRLLEPGSAIRDHLPQKR